MASDICREGYASSKVVLHFQLKLSLRLADRAASCELEQRYKLCPICCPELIRYNLLNARWALLMWTPTASCMSLWCEFMEFDSIYFKNHMLKFLLSFYDKHFPSYFSKQRGMYFQRDINWNTVFSPKYINTCFSR